MLEDVPLFFFNFWRYIFVKELFIFFKCLQCLRLDFLLNVLSLIIVNLRTNKTITLFNIVNLFFNFSLDIFNSKWTYFEI